MWDSVGVSGMHGKGPTEGSRGGRARAERTWNMYFTVVTLDVSKLSGWLNAVAACRVERRAYDAVRDAGREVGGLGAMAAQAVCRGECPTKICGDQGTRGAHVEHVVHECDAGRVEAQRLVERHRALPSRKGGIRCGARCGRRGGNGVGRRRRKRHARGGPDSRLGATQGTRGAHPEHVAHVRDAGRVEAQWLVERLRLLPSRKEGMRCGARCAGRAALAARELGLGAAAGESGAHAEDPTGGLEGQSTPGPRPRAAGAPRTCCTCS